MEATAAGDAQAYRKIVDRHLPPIVAYAQRMLGERAAAEDVAQETFLRLWKQAPRWQPRARLSTYLHRITHNLAIDHLRRRRPQAGEPDAQTTGERPSGLLGEKRTALAVQEAVAALPERQRAALTLVHYQGMSQQEAAEVLEVSVEALESLLARARRSLKETLAAWMEEGDHE